MASKIVIEGSITALQMKEFWSQVGLGVIDGPVMQAVLEHRNPWTGHVLTIDRTTPFNPATFIGLGWTIEEPDGPSSLPTEVNFDHVSFKTCLNPGESRITGVEKLKRHAIAGHVLADAKIGQALYEEKGQKILEYLYKEKGIDWLEFPGTILRSPRDDRYTLCLCRSVASWYWCCNWLGNGRDADGPSLMLAST